MLQKTLHGNDLRWCLDAVRLTDMEGVVNAAVLTEALLFYVNAIIPKYSR